MHYTASGVSAIELGRKKLRKQGDFIENKQTHSSSSRIWLLALSVSSRTVASTLNNNASL
jgi:hypothetical protein